MKTEEVKLLTYNPFWGKEILKHFINGSSEKKVSLNLSFLVFPIILNDSSRSILSSARNDSTLESSFLNNSFGKIALGGIEKRYEIFKDLTHKSIVLSCQEKSLLIENETINLNCEIDYKKENDFFIKEYFRAAHYLGIIFSNANSELDIFLKLRIREI